MGLGWGVAYQIYFSLISKKVSWKFAQLVYWGIFLSAWVGAKLFFYLTLPNHLSDDLISNLSFWMGGGFVFYGGLIGALIFLLVIRLLGFEINREVLWPILPALTFGHGIGRIGCFLAGCCYGSPTTLSWGVFMHGMYRHPTQLIEAGLLFMLGFYLLKSKHSIQWKLAFYFVSYGVIRFLNELLRGDSIRGEWGVLTPSQWISLLLVLMGIAIFSIKSRH